MNDLSTGTMEEMLRFLWSLLSDPELPDNLEIANGFKDYEKFEEIVQSIIDLRELSAALNKGYLNKSVNSKGYIISNLKALQSNLRHLVWQTKKIADGDFTQKVDFLGHFSDSFNEMTAKLRTFSKELTALANVDALTQIPNRLSLVQFLSKTFTKFSVSNEQFSVLIIDIDYFKKVNDTYGHDTGDKVLVRVSEIINEKFRSSDIFARYGGEEFIAVLTNAGTETAFKTAQRIIQTMNETPIRIDDDTALNITVSIGVSQSKQGDKEYNDVIVRCDKALYVAKENGRNQVAVL